MHYKPRGIEKCDIPERERGDTTCNGKKTKYSNLERIGEERDKASVAKTEKESLSLLFYHKLVMAPPRNNDLS